MLRKERHVACCFIFANLLQHWGADWGAVTAAVIQNSGGGDKNCKLIFGTNHGVFSIPSSSFEIGATSSSSTAAKNLANFTEKSVAVSCDARRNEVYWSDVSESEDVGKLDKASMDGHDYEVLVDVGLRYLEGVAYDWIAENVYLIDIKWKRIVVCGGVGTGFCSVLVKEITGQPRSVALEPNQGLMFWTDWGKQPAIMQAGMDGSGAKAIVSTDLEWPNGICVDVQQDAQERRVFWTDAGKDRIESVKLDGSDRQTIITVIGSHPFGIDVFGGRLFWSDWLEDTIISADKTTGLDKKIIYRSDKGVPYELAICYVVNQPIYRQNNPCKDSGCSHICALSFESGHRCLCPEGMVLDGMTCQDSPKTSSYMYVADKNTIRFMRLHSIGKFESVIIPELRSIKALTHNPAKTNSLILSDSSRKIIYECDMSTKKLEALVAENEVDEVVAMDFDPIGENLYWIDAKRGTLEVMSLRTKARAVIRTGVENRTDILVVPELGRIFISIAGVGGGKSNKCQLDGDGLSFFSRLGGKQPTVLTYDNDRIYWIDKVEKTVHYTLLSNGITFDANITADSPMPNGMIFEREVLVLGIELSTMALKLHRKSKVMARDFGGHAAIAVSRNMTSPKLQALLSSHECSWENPQRKKCSHICLLSGEGNRGGCHCPEGSQLGEDGLTCVGQVGGGAAATDMERPVNQVVTTPALERKGPVDCSGSWCSGGEKKTAEVNSHAVSFTDGRGDGEEREEGSHTLVLILGVSTGLLAVILTAFSLVVYWLYKKDAIKAHVHMEGNKPVVCVGHQNGLLDADDDIPL